MARETSPAVESQKSQPAETQTWRMSGGCHHLLSSMAAAPQKRPGRVPQTLKMEVIQAQQLLEGGLQMLRAEEPRTL